MDGQSVNTGFDGDTLVTLSSNGTIPISTIEEMSRDEHHPKQFEVLSYDSKKSFIPKKVVSCLKIPLGKNDKILRITCEAKATKGTYIISAITAHNTLFQTSNRKTQAGLLESGEMLVGIFNGNEALLKVTSIKHAKISTPFLYNLVIDGDSGFLVGGKNSILTVS